MNKEQLINKCKDMDIVFPSFLSNTFKIELHDGMSLVSEYRDDTFIKGDICKTNEDAVKRKDKCEQDYIKQLQDLISIKEAEIKEADFEENVILKHFRKDIKPATRGTLLKCLKKMTYFNGNKSDIYKYYELVDKAIKEGIGIEFKYKTIMNNLLYVYDYDLKKWV